MQNELQVLEALSDRLAKQGQALYDVCQANLYPADIVALSVLDRSLSLLKGFVLLIRNGGYIPAAGILRMQLDNILRFNGIISSADPHGVANQVINSVPLRTIKDRAGKKMTDARLKELLSDANPWIENVYNLSSGYIHLSDQHVRHVLQRSTVNSEEPEGARDIAIGDEDVYLSDAQRLNLVNTFSMVTDNVLNVVSHWCDKRSMHGSEAELSARFKTAV